MQTDAFQEIISFANMFVGRNVARVDVCVCGWVKSGIEGGKNHQLPQQQMD